MKAKTQLLTLVSMATLALGGVTVTSSLLLNTPENHSINAETVDDTVGTVRLWISSDKDNPISNDNGFPKLWIHTEPGTTDAEKGEEIWRGTETGNWHNQIEGKRTYYYFDVPAKDIVGNYLTIERYAPGGTERWNDSNPYEITAENVTQVFYLWRDLKTISTGSPDSVDAGMAAEGLEGLQTCSTSSINGYNAFKGVAKSFIHKDDGTWKTSGFLNECTISDYADVSAYSSGERSIQVNAQDKYDALSIASGITF